MLPSDWQLLRAGEGADVILAVDFPVTGPEPSLHDVAQLLDVPYSIWQPWRLRGGPDRRCRAVSLVTARPRRRAGRAGRAR